MSNHKAKKQIIALMKTFRQVWANVTLSQQASSMAYFTLLAMFPLLIAAANVIPLLPINSQEVLMTLKTAVPEDIYGIIAPIIRGYLNESTGGALSLSLLISIWPATKGLGVVQIAMNEVYHTKPRANFILRRLLSFMIGLVIMTIFIAVSMIFVFGEQVIRLIENLMGTDFHVMVIFGQLKWSVAFIVIFCISLALYWLMPNVSWPVQYAIPGAAFFTIAFLTISQLFSWYVKVTTHSIETGMLSVFVVLMMWLYMISIALILGGVLNVFLYRWYHPMVNQTGAQQDSPSESGIVDKIHLPRTIKFKGFKKQDLKNKKMQEEYKNAKNTRDE
ncbi:YihY/virulence factor BrkB family protein [Atopobacter sp. AH10]|uniref:YihY/virulence factor BrkB family protein n=1 Tax=Atopobacter sp. AH10 TaxID=2315861 RepID=UPI000EF24E6C|nr:YihY/virulence factor BrkB family protein [Atopobacter sp. AH10]RLK64069.1 YihY/virulence factor BrkB family protein [Atopobacter sp. AH10]